MGRPGADLGEGDLAGSSFRGRGRTPGWDLRGIGGAQCWAHNRLQVTEREWGKFGWGEREGIEVRYLHLPPRFEETRQRAEYEDNSGRSKGDGFLGGNLLRLRESRSWG